MMYDVAMYCMNVCTAVSMYSIIIQYPTALPGMSFAFHHLVFTLYALKMGQLAKKQVHY